MRRVKKERSLMLLFQGVYRGREKVLQVELWQEVLTKNMQDRQDIQDIQTLNHIPCAQSSIGEKLLS